MSNVQILNFHSQPSQVSPTPNHLLCISVSVAFQIIICKIFDVALIERVEVVLYDFVSN